MIDIHTHILCKVDDGSTCLDTSIKMIEKEIADGVTDIILTPHHDLRLFKYDAESIKENYHLLINEIKNRDLKINLYLGCEILYASEVKKKLKNLSFESSKYILVEFEEDYNNIEEAMYDLVALGYKPILAHVERYKKLNLEDIIEIKNDGGFIQVNAGALIGLNGLRTKFYIKRLIKLDLVDFIASDCHNMKYRVPNFKRAYDYLSKKYGIDYADKVCTNNQKLIIEDINAKRGMKI